MAPAEACYIVSTLSRQFDVILRQEREFLAKYRNFEILSTLHFVKTIVLLKNSLDTVYIYFRRKRLGSLETTIYARSRSLRRL